MTDLTSREQVFRATDSGDDLEIAHALNKYRSSLVQILANCFNEHSDKARLVLFLRELDSEVTKTCYEGNAEVPWYYFRDAIEDVLEVPRGTLDTGPYEEDEDD